MIKKAEYLFFHCSDYPYGNIEQIRAWHKARGWKDIGYNGLIYNGRVHSDNYDESKDGLFVEARSMDFSEYVESEEIGAQVLGYNNKSLGVCLIGKDKFTIKQFQTAGSIAAIFIKINPEIKIMGHYESPTAGGKTCPNFDMNIFRDYVKGMDFSYGKTFDLFKKYLR